MTHINFIEKQIEILVESLRPPKEMRDKIDIGFTYSKYTLEIFEISPKWDNEKEMTHMPIAKTKYVKSQEIWKIYWMRANGKWEAYPPQREVKTINEFFEILKKDDHACFWG